MLEGLYSAAAGMLAQQTRLDAVSNDLANVNTTGYKHVRVAFRDLVYDNPGRGTQSPAVQTGAGAAARFLGRGFEAGALQDTGNPLDVALQGSGFLQVRRGDGTLALTRDGALDLDADGRLVTARGDVVQPPLRVPRGTDAADVAIAADGTVSVHGRRLGRLSIVDVTAPDGLRAIGDSSFAVTAASGPTHAARGTTVAQGKLEASNVQIADAIVDMTEAQRAYELASRAIQVQDQILQIANAVKR